MKMVLSVAVACIFGVLVGLAITSSMTATLVHPPSLPPDNVYPVTYVSLWEKGGFQPEKMTVTIVRNNREMPIELAAPLEPMTGEGNYFIVKDGQATLLLRTDFVLAYKSAEDGDAFWALLFVFFSVCGGVLLWIVIYYILPPLARNLTRRIV